MVTAVVGLSPARADLTNPLKDLVDAAAQRLQFADPVAADKWINRAAIEDPTRVQQQLTSVAADAAARGIDADYVTQVFADQINATEGVEYQRFARWKLDPASAPTTAADLSVARAAIDDLNAVMLGQIGLQWVLLHSPACAGRLDAAQQDISRARELDAVYRKALVFATRSYCRP